MFEKRRYVISALADAGMRRTGAAAKRPALTEAAHCTDARHVTVRPHALEVCLAPVDKAPQGSRMGDIGHCGPWRGCPRDMSGDVGREEAGK